MDLSSLPFLFLFLPAFLVIYIIAKRTSRVILISIANIVFLFWGQATALWWLISILVTTYAIGRLVSFHRSKNKKYQVWVWIAILFNLFLLSVHKLNVAYGAYLLPKFELPTGWTSSIDSLIVPIGLSYITFQSISYIIDVARGVILVETNFLNLTAFLLFFPKLISGPLMHYKSFSDQLNDLNVSATQVANGFRRLLIGFIKRILIANQLGTVVNAAFGLPSANFEPHIAWLVIISYTLQIYFDFSGYTDMALGLGNILGIKLPENFNSPYQADSVSDFWRRWHMSLTTWFREYVFYPLERHRFKWLGQQINILIVFILTGLWHGFKPHFVVWGFIHGLFLSMESLGLARKLKYLWRPFRHLYTLSIVILGWIFFRSENLRFALSLIKRLIGNTEGMTPLPFSQTTPLPFIEPSFVIVLLIGITFLFPIKQIWRNIQAKVEPTHSGIFWGFQISRDILLILSFLLSLAILLSNGFLPNIYANF